MRLLFAPNDEEKLMLYVTADIARRRRTRGLRLNYPETVALICEALLEMARDGKSVADCMSFGREILGEDDVLPHVAALVDVVQVEATFLDGTKLISCHNPIQPGERTGWQRYGR